MFTFSGEKVIQNLLVFRIISEKLIQKEPII